MKKKKELKLKELDLTKGEGHNHPDIDINKTYLCKIDGNYFAGTFNIQWYGLNFNGWWCGLQYDKPGTNSSSWERIWEIIE